MPRLDTPKNYIVNAGDTLLDCTNPSIWNYLYHSDTPTLDNSITLNDVPALKITGNSTGVFETGVNGLKDLTGLDTIEVKMYIYNNDELNALQIRLWSSSGNYWACYLTGRYTGYYNARIPLSSFTKTGNPSLSNINRTYFTVTPTTGLNTSIGIFEVKYNSRNIPKVLFTWDDGWLSTYTNAFPILSAAGFKATTWINSDNAQGTNENWMHKAELDELYAAGWAIGNHSKDHATSGILDDYDALYANYGACQDYILSQGWTRGAYHICYPSGLYSETLFQVMRDLGVETGRTVKGEYNPTPVINPYMLRVMTLSLTSTFAGVKPYIDYAIRTGVTLIFMLHGCGTESGLDIPVDVLQQIVNYLVETKVDVVTISEWYNGLSNARYRSIPLSRSTV